jgi:predicted metal-dependent hydrolase
MEFIEYFLIVIVIVILFFYIKNHYAEVTYVKSTIDNEHYLVRRLSDKQEAADTIAKLAADMEKLIKHLLAKYPTNSDIKRLYENFNKKNISESSPDSGYTSYTVDKGKRLLLCLRQKNSSNSFVDYQILIYTICHEIAHIGSEDIGHTPAFWEFFKLILTEAVEIGLYKKVDYSKKPVDFCGIKITSSVI